MIRKVLSNIFSDLIHTTPKTDAVGATPISVSTYVPVQAHNFLLQTPTTLCKRIFARWRCPAQARQTRIPGNYWESSQLVMDRRWWINTSVALPLGRTTKCWNWTWTWSQTDSKFSLVLQRVQLEWRSSCHSGVLPCFYGRPGAPSWNRLQSMSDVSWCINARALLPL